MSNGCGDGYHMEGGVCVPNSSGVATVEALAARVSYFAVKEVVNCENDEIDSRAEAAAVILKETLKKLAEIGYPAAKSKA